MKKMNGIKPQRHSAFRASVAALLLLSAAMAAKPAAAQAQHKDEVVVAASLLLQRFDPTQIVALTEYLVDDLLYDGLINNGPAGKYPALATKWTISPDGKQFDFELRKGVTFHNGDPFTAEDVKFTYDLILRADSKHTYRKAFADSIERIEVVDPLRVRFVLKQPWLSFLSSARYTLQPIIPKNYYEKVGAAGFQQKPIGTGPFKLESISPGEWNRFEANASYWGAKPKVRYIKQQLVGEPFTRYAMLQKGEADIATGLTGPLLDRIRENKEVQVLFSQYSGTSMLFFNLTKFPEAKDKRVREAIGHAINRPGIAAGVLRGACQPSDAVVTPSSFGHLPGLKAIPYDQAKARKLLGEAGLAAGKEVTMVIPTQASSLPSAPQVMEAIAGSLEAVGLKIVRETYDTAAWNQMMRGGKQSGIFYGSSAMPDDAGALMETWYLSNSPFTAGFVRDPDFDRIFDDQAKATTIKAREQLLQNFSKIDNERRVSIPLFWCSESFAVTNRIKNFKPGIGSPYHLHLQSIEISSKR